MVDHTSPTAEWEQVLAGTLAFLRTQAASELDYSGVIRMERAAWRRSRALLADLGLDSELSPPTDELLRSAVAPEAGRQSAAEQVLGAAAIGAAAVGAAGALVDDGPEGVADDANRELSEEVSKEPEVKRQRLVPERIDTSEELLDDMDTAPPGAQTPLGKPYREAEGTGFDEAPPTLTDDTPALSGAIEPTAPTDDTNTFEGELDLDAIEEIPVTEGDDLLELEELEPAPPGVEPAPLLSDFDFDDDEEQDETVVFALGGGKAGEEVARLIEEHNRAEAEEAAAEPAEEEEELLELEPEVDSFDLMPELDDDELELEEVDLDDDDLELEPLSFDDDTDMEAESASAGVSVGTGGRKRSSAAGVTAGLYGNPNVPTIRDTKQAAPRAAAIQINATAGTGKMMGFEEEEEPLAIGAAEDYGEEIDDDESGNFGGGLSLSVQTFGDDDDDDEWEDEDSEEEVAAEAPAPVYQGPDLSHVAGVLAQAQEAAARGDMQTGVDLFSDVLDADPDQVEAYVGRGRLYLDLGDYSRAMSDFMTAEDLAPKSPEPQVAIGDLYFARKDYRKAIDYFNGALSMDPNHAMAHCRRGISHYYRKNYADALSDLKTAEKLDEDIPNIGTYISMAQKKAKK